MLKPEQINSESGVKRVLTDYDADSILKEIAECERELRHIKNETMKSIRILKDCAHSENEDLKKRIENLKLELLTYVAENRDKLKPSGRNSISMSLPSGVIGLKKSICFRTLIGRRTIRSIEIEMKTILKNEHNESDFKIKTMNLNKLSNDTLNKFGIIREDFEEFYCNTYSL